MSSIEASKPTLFSVSLGDYRENTMLLPEAFATASISGLWLPRDRQSCTWSLRLYRAYTCFTLTTMLLIMISQLVALTFLARNVDELVEAAYVFFEGVNACVKGLNMLIRRRRIVELTDMFDDWKCVPQTDEELKLCGYFDKMSRYTVLSFMGLGLFSGTYMGGWPLFFSGENRELSVRAWQPYEITSSSRYLITQTHQMLSLVTMVFWNGSNDALCFGFMMQICSQLQLMCHRLRRLPDGAKLQSRLVKQSVQHHLHVFEMKRRLEAAFTPAILSQYLLSSLVLCISIYQLTNNPSDFVQTSVMILYVGAMAVELLMYCWFGNEVAVTSLKFSEMVCQANWTKLHVSNRKGLLIMMLRSSLPIRIRCGPLITLSTESYARILKLSYSAFNVLQRRH